MTSMGSDKRTIRRAFEAASDRYDEAAVLQAEVRNRMLARLDFVKLEPACVLDVGAGTGDAAAALARRFKRSRVICLDFATGMLRQARRRQSMFRKLHLVCGDAACLPLTDASVDLIFCSLVLQWCPDPTRVFQEFARILRPHGVVTLSTLGPDTLTELKQAFTTVDDEVHVNTFPDMHLVGDAMVRAGLAEPVMDVEMFTLTYEHVVDVMRDLKAIGASTVMGRGRPRGLMGKGQLDKLRQGYEAFRREGRLPATYEVVYGQAWGAPVGQGAARRQAEARIPASSIKRRGSDE